MFLDRMHRARVVRRLQARTDRLSKDIGQWPSVARLIGHRKGLTGLAFLGASFVLGAWARQAAQAEALASWLKANPPSRQVWKHALESRGYRSSLDPRSSHKALRSLPTLLDEQSAVWASSDLQWIAIFHNDGPDATGPTLYCLDCTKASQPPQSWTPSGRGWLAYDPVLAMADQAAAARRPPPRTRTLRPDPRELRY